MSLISLDVAIVTNDTACATSSAPLPAGTAAVKVTATCGGQRDDDAPATTVVTMHDPHAFLASLCVAQTRDVPTTEAAVKPAAEAQVGAGTSHQTRSRSRGGGSAAAGTPAAAGYDPPRAYASTADTRHPRHDVVLLLPAVAAATGEPSRAPLAVPLAVAAELLRPVLRAIGHEAAVAALAAVPGLRDLGEQQRAEARAALEAAVAAAAPRLAGDGGGRTDSAGSGGSGAAAATGADAAVAAAVRPDEDEVKAQRSTRRRVASDTDGRREEVSAPGGEVVATAAPVTARGAARPPLPRRSTRGGAREASEPRSHSHAAAGSKQSGQPASGDASAAISTGGATAHRGKAASGGNGGVGPAAADPGADLDRERAELMERNRRKLMELQLPGLVAGLAATGHGAAVAAAGAKRQATQRGVGAKRRREASQEPPPPRRVSLRQRGVAADAALAAGIDHETATGVQLVAGRQAVEAAAGKVGAAGTEEEKERHPKGELPFRSDNGDQATDAAFLALLKAAAAAADVATGSSGRQSGSKSDRDLGGEALARLSLAERDVAKVTKDGVTHMAWLPGTERLLLAAADKAGKVSLWDVDVEEGGAAADTDGVLMFSPHSEYVSGLRWLDRDAAVGPCRLITVAYDGSLRALDLGGAGTWLELPAPGDSRVSEFSALEVSSDGRTAYLGDPLGNLDVVDLRAPPPPPVPLAEKRGRVAAAPAEAEHWVGGSEGGAAVGRAKAAMVAAGPAGGLQLCARKINSLHLEPSGGHLLASSCSDGTVALWDVRKLGAAAAVAAAGRHKTPHKPLGVLHHGKSCHAAYWAHDGSGRLLSTSYDDTIRVWSAGGVGGTSIADGALFTQTLSIRHNNQTGRWITPFRAVWNAACNAVLVGNMKRGLDVFAVEGVGGAAPAGAAVKSGGGRGGSHTHLKASGKDADGVAGQLLRTLASDAMTAIPSRVACHPTLPVVVAATSSGRCHVWR